MNPNDVLIWMSARRLGSWAGYESTLEEMGTTGEGDADDSEVSDLSASQRLRFNLERLGHVEFRRRDFPNGWRVVPPTIAVVGDELKGILCGARTDEFLGRICTAFGGVRVTTQTECPDLIELDLPGDFERVAATNGALVQGCASESLLAASPTVDDGQLRTACELPFGNDSPVTRFDADMLNWNPSSPSEARSARLGLFRWQVPFGRHYYLRIGQHSYRVPVQVGKYWILRRKRRRVLAFKEEERVLRVPVTCRPPLLVDRALTLRTGKLPAIHQGALVYENITRSIALMTAAVLKQ